MLIIKVYKDEYVQIGDDIKVYFKGGEFGFSRLGTEAPKDVRIERIKVGEEKTDRKQMWERSL